MFVTLVFSFKLITVVDFHRPNVCVPSKFLLKPNAVCDGTGRWGLWTILGHESEFLIWDQSFHKRGFPGGASGKEPPHTHLPMQET